MTRPTPTSNSKAVPRSLSVLIAVLLLNLVMQPLSLGRDRGAPRANDRSSQLDGPRAGDDPANLIFVEAKGRLAAENERRRLQFTSAGMRFIVKAASEPDSRGSFEFRFKKATVGESVLIAEGSQGTEPVSQGNEVFYARSGAVLEKYRATERGVEQLILLDRNFATSGGDLEITGEVATTLAWEEAPVRALGAITFYSEHGPALNFGPVLVTDASGRQSELETRLEGTRLTLAVDGTWLRGAIYPLAVQSSIQMLATPSRGVFGEPISLEVKDMSGVTSIEDTPVWRAHVRFFTTDVNGGGTDDPVTVSLNSNNSTRLYSSYRDDFERGHSYGYDLILNNVTKLGDITKLQISKTGVDEWSIKSFTFYVNGKAVYSADFSGGLWLNTNPWSSYDTGTHVVTSSDLRNHSLWRSYIVPAPPIYISGAELMSRIEAIVGDHISDNVLRFSPYVNGSLITHAVQVSGNGPRTIRVDVDLKYRQLHKSFWIWDWKWVTYEVDVEFDLEFSCSNGKLFLVTKNLDMAYPVVDNASMVNKLLLQMLLQIDLPLKIQSALQTVTYTDDLGQPACPPIRVVGNSVYLY